MNHKALSVIKVKMVVIGDAGVGKTSLVLRFTQNVFNYYSHPFVEDKSVVLKISETAGQEDYRCMVESFYRDAGIALILYDMSSHKSFENIESWLLQIQQYGPQDLKCALIGNKIDLDEDVRYVREVQTQEGQLLAERHGWYFAETSAKSGEGIERVFHDMGSALVESCKKENESPTVSLCDSYVHRILGIYFF